MWSPCSHGISHPWYTDDSKIFLAPSPLCPLGNWAFLSEYLIGTLNSTVQNWTHFLPTPGAYRICTQIRWLGIPPWPLLFVFSSIQTSYGSWTHMPFYILSPSQNSCCWAQTPIYPRPINTLLAICLSVPAFDHVHLLIVVLTILYCTLYLVVLNWSSLKRGSVAYYLFTPSSCYRL